MAKEDFGVGLLQGLYNAGVGNPQVNEERRMNQLKEAYLQQQMAAEAQDRGMEVHPIMKDRGFLGALTSALFFPGSGGGLQQSFVPSSTQYGVTPEGELEIGKVSPGSIRVSPKEAREIRIKKASQPAYVVPQLDSEGNITGYTPVPKGSKPTAFAKQPRPIDEKAQLKLRTNQPKEKALLTNALSNFDRMIQEAEAIRNHPSLATATGMTAPLGLISGTGAKNVRSRINTLKSKTGFSVLQEMRNSSPTGGALGQVSDRENQMLQENIASLDVGQSTQDFKNALERIINYANGAKQRLKDAYNETYSGIGGEFKEQTQPTPSLGDAPQGKPQTVIQNGHTYTLNPLTGQYE